MCYRSIILYLLKDSSTLIKKGFNNVTKQSPSNE